MLKEPKNPSSLQQIKMSKMAVDALRAHRERQAIERQNVGDQWRDRDLVFATTTGTLVGCQNFIARNYRPLLAKAGVPVVRFHDLRQFATMLRIASGVPLKVVSEVLGHADIQTTANLYGHVMLSMQQQAADNMARRLGA